MVGQDEVCLRTNPERGWSLWVMTLSVHMSLLFVSLLALFMLSEFRRVQFRLHRSVLDVDMLSALRDNFPGSDGDEFPCAS